MLKISKIGNGNVKFMVNFAQNLWLLYQMVLVPSSCCIKTHLDYGEDETVVMLHFVFLLKSLHQEEAHCSWISHHLLCSSVFLQERKLAGIYSKYCLEILKWYEPGQILSAFFQTFSEILVSKESSYFAHNLQLSALRSRWQTISKLVHAIVHLLSSRQ